MRPWNIVDEEEVPEDEAIMYLMRRGGEYAIVVDGYELMSNRLHGSEDALADLACDRLVDVECARVLVGGLGMGFTLAAVLRRIGKEGAATVAELLPAVVKWNQEHLGRVAGYPLHDPRVSVHVGDVAELVEQESSWDAILLDVDNGPRALTRPNNGWLYTPEGLRTAHKALRPGGILGIWSAARDPTLTRRLRITGFQNVELLEHNEPKRPTPDDTGTHILWMARAGASPS